MKQRIYNGHSLEFYNEDNSKKGELRISGSDIVINPMDSEGTVIFGEEGSINDIEIGASGTPVDFTFLGGGTLTSNGGTLTLGVSGDTVDLSNATIGTVTASIFKGGQFIGDGSGLTSTPSTFTHITASGNISASGDLYSNEQYLGQYIYHIGDTNSYFGFSGTDNWKLKVNNKNVIHAHDNGNLYLYGDNGTALTLDGNQDATFANNVTVAGNISASGNIFGQKFGRDTDNLIDFSTDNQITVKVNNVAEYEFAENVFRPTTTDGAALGDTNHLWSDLFLRTGAVINFNQNDVLLTHSTDTLTMTGGTFVAESATITNLTVTALTSSIVTSSILLTEGSNIFGDAASDSHRFTGSIFVSSSGTIGPNSAAGIEFGDGTHGNEPADITIFTDTNGEIHLKRGGSNKISVQDNGIDIDEEVHVRDGSFNNAIVLSQNGHITASGNISSSGVLYAKEAVFTDSAGVVIDLLSSTSDSYLRWKDGGTSKFSLGFDNGDSTFAISTGSGLSNNQAFTINSDGNVGIGTSNPQSPVTIEGNAASVAAGTAEATYKGYLQVTGNGGNISTAGGIEFKAADSGNGYGFRISNPDLGNGETPLYFLKRSNTATWTSAMTILGSNGKVGIGTTTPTEALQVTGNISASGNLTGLSGSLSVLGVGTTTPSDPLHVVGNIRWTGNATNAGNGNVVMGTGQLKFADTGKVMIGDSNDLQIYHDGSNSQIADTGAGSLDISSNHIHLRSAVDGGDNLAQFFAGGHSYIYGNNVMRMEATAYGVNLVGPITGSSHIQLGGSVSASQVSSSGNIVASGTGSFSEGRFTGKLGVGIDSPFLPLHVDGNARIDGNLLVGNCAPTNTPAADLHLKSSGTDAKIRIEDLDDDNLAYDFLVNSGSGLTITETTDATSRIHIAQGTGNVGIGTASPGTKLQIDNGGSGTVDAAYSLAIRGDGIDGIQILSSNAHEGRLVFGDADDNDRGQIKYDHATDSMKFKVNASDAMTISGSDGSVGIGTTSPSELLHVAGNITLGNNKKLTFRDSSGNDGTSITYDSNALFKITQANSGELRLNAGFNDNSSNKITFQTQGSAERMRITNDGKVGIGTAAPDSELHVVGDISASGQIFLQNNKFIKQRLASGTIVTVFGYDSGNLTRVGANAEIQLGGDIRFNTNISTHVTASGNISSSGLISTNTLNIASTADGGATIGNDQILHEGITATANNLTVGSAAEATTAGTATNVTATANNSTNETVYLTFVDGATGAQGIETDTGLSYNPSTNTMSVGRVAGTDIDAGTVTVSDSFDLRAGNGGIGTSGGLTSVGITNSSTYSGGGRITLSGGAGSYIEATGYVSSSVSVNAPTGSFEVLVGDTSQATSLEVDGPITGSIIKSTNDAGFVGTPMVIHQFMAYLPSFTDGNFYYGHNTYGPYHHVWTNNLSSEPTDMSGLGAARHAHFMHIVPVNMKNISLKGTVQASNVGADTVSVKVYKTTRSNSTTSTNSTLTLLGTATSDNIDNVNHCFNMDMSSTSTVNAGEAIVLLMIPTGTSCAIRANWTLYGYTNGI